MGATGTTIIIPSFKNAASVASRLAMVVVRSSKWQARNVSEKRRMPLPPIFFFSFSSRVLFFSPFFSSLLSLFSFHFSLFSFLSSFSFFFLLLSSLLCQPLLLRLCSSPHRSRTRSSSLIAKKQPPTLTRSPSPINQQLEQCRSLSKSVNPS